MPDSRVVFVALVALVAAQRLVELSYSRRNVRRALERGGREYGASLYPWMVALHAGFLVSGPVEVFLLQRPWFPRLGAAMAVVLILAQGLRYWTIATLGERWTTRVLYVPGDRVIGSGPYRWINHPNYAAVVVEFIALPLFHSAWMTAAAFSALNAIVIRRRLVVENEVLRREAAA